MRLTDEQREQVIELRRRHSLSEVASLAGLSLGTVKTIVSRSGLFTDNPRQRAMFTLPPIESSGETLPAAQELPPQQAVTGDKELDAVLWLRQVIEIGDPARIEQAKEAAGRIATPLDELEKRYSKWLLARSSGNPFATFGSIGLANLDALAKRAIEQRANQAEAVGRFGGELWAETKAEWFCIEAMRSVEQDRLLEYDKTQAAERFKALPELMPHTLADCLWELNYWDGLYRLRHASDRKYMDQRQEVYARYDFVFSLLAELRPRSSDEAKAVLRHLLTSSHTEGNRIADVEAILNNLIR
ncbi:hypothetical protein [Aeromonas sp. D3]|uniref:hypothetical protein n=1 Tax=Aeromonas sp. D3 TaxID=2990474 RepID=UPI0022E79DDF|nr:hypothetical protein [Aeromonas sp. D3]